MAENQNLTVADEVAKNVLVVGQALDYAAKSYGLRAVIEDIIIRDGRVRYLIGTSLRLDVPSA